MEAPTAEPGPVRAIFGPVLVKSPIILFFGLKSTKTYKIDA